MTVVFTFATAILHTLLGVDRRVWRLAVSADSSQNVAEEEMRFTHRMLKHLSGWLPASNGVVILLGLPGLIWQAAALSWSWPSLAVLSFWIAGQVWILSAGRIARLVRGPASRRQRRASQGFGSRAALRLSGKRSLYPANYPFLIRGDVRSGRR